MDRTSPPTVRLGENGPRVGVQGLGCMGMSEFYGPTDETESRATLEAALAAGVTLYDTADMYGSGANEEFLAPFVAAHREEITIATKFGVVRDPDDPASRVVRGDRDYVRRCVEGSLRRLGVDVIDLYYMHRPDPNVPVADTVGFMSELVTEGKVRHLGLSEVTASELRAGHQVHPIAALQSEWSLFSRDIEVNVVPTAAELGVGLVPYSPLGRGFLAGAFADAAKELSEGDVRRGWTRFAGHDADENRKLLAPIRRVAESRGVGMATVALAWVHRRADAHDIAVVPIPGTRKRSRLAENVAAASFELSADELAALEPIAGRVVGARYPKEGSTYSAQRE